jgi:tryptophan halogenase
MNIVIVGGGTAGWLTAIYAKKMYPEKNIVLIESEEIGILGAGEGSTPHLLRFLSFLEISLNELISECKVSIKNGIKFSNWSSNNNDYMHPFASFCQASNDYNFSLNDYLESDTAFSHIISSQFDHKFNDYVFIQRLSYLNKVPFMQDFFINENVYTSAFSNISIHFDANLLAQYLRRIGERRGIIRKEGIVKKILTDKNGYINYLKVDDQNIAADFVFDCTGFKRLIIGNFYKSLWHSHKNNLPANSAIPFFLPKEEDLPPYTESIAMNYGWMWKIPLQHRYGCGYVFDKNSISEDDAKNEIDRMVGFEVDSPRSFSFDAGFYKNIWIKNCVAIGLASGFIEPLEATSIWQSIEALKTFFSSYGNIYNKNQKIIDNFNKKYEKETQEIVDFLYLHYTTNKKNTKFWKNFTKNNDMPEFVEYILSVAKERPIDKEIDFLSRSNLFATPSLYYILIGNGLITQKNLIKQASLMKTNKNNEYSEIINNQQNMIKNFLNHRKFLKMIGGE